METPILFVISGPSGVGKGTLLDNLVKAEPKLQYSVSATTRNMRPGEQEGVNYFYKTKEEFKSLVEAGDVIEWDEYQGNCYGTLASCIDKSLENGRSIAFDITVPGAEALKKRYGDRAVTVFILPDSFESLKDRLLKRGREGTDEIERRFRFAITNEVEKFREFDYVVVNNVLEDAVNDLHRIFNAELAHYNIKNMASSENRDILEDMLHISKFM